MAERKGIEVSIAIAEAAARCDTDIVAAYPITPQTHVVEHLAELVADGELDAEFIPVESEHSALSVCAGTAAVGARTFTATSSQGLALMHEILYIVAACRLPIVMVVANRALSAPINIWNDHSDVMAERDTGWIQVFVENGQEAFDHVVYAFRLAEDQRVSLPVMVNFDGFLLSHVVEPIELLTAQEIAKYLPPFAPLQRLDVDHPITMGPVGVPEVYTEAIQAHEAVLRSSIPVIKEAWAEFGKTYGRNYQAIETYRATGAEIVFVTMGSISETVATAIDQLREEGHKVGQLKIRLWRPFPFDDFRQAAANAKVLVVVDRCLSKGGPGGPVASELKAALYHDAQRPLVVEFIAGLGGRDVPVDDFRQMFRKASGVLKGEPVPPFELVAVRK